MIINGERFVDLMNKQRVRLAEKTAPKGGNVMKKYIPMLVLAIAFGGKVFVEGFGGKVF